MITRQTNQYSKGQVGIGTLIVFISIVLVAAVVASVLISAGEIISERGEQTAVDSTQEIGDRVAVTGVFGVIDDPAASDSQVEELQINLRLGPGVDAINTEQLLIDYTGAENQYFLRENRSDFGSDVTAGDENGFAYEVVDLVDESGGLAASPRILQSTQDRAQIRIPLTADISGGDEKGIDQGQNAKLNATDRISFEITTAPGATSNEPAQVPGVLNKKTVRLG